ncbi:ABC transporter ATP-binding protein [Geminicoccaceae bacterium 1502E]|nr:ABC transporter ATP-binding protein [Geminicoccaceae bacterium 1502E]
MLLEVSGIEKRFSGVQAVAGVSFSVAQGEILGVIGPNGSGKSTLFNCILGQLRPDAGRVRLEGSDVTGLAPVRLARAGIGRTFQMLQVFGRLSVRQNLLLAGQEHRGTRLGRLLAAPDCGLGGRAEELMGFFRLGPLADAPAASLSYGQQKLLDLAMALMPEPRLVLLDEPAGGVNLTMLREMGELLVRWNRERGTTFVVIEHNMDFILRHTSRVVVLAQGRIIADGAPEAVRRDATVIEAYLGG